jgi:hypothetical protein
MKKSELISLIKEVLQDMTSKIKEDNIHGEGTQRQFVINLAKKLGGYISISDIADALGLTNDDVRNNYARLIRYFSNKNNDFEKVVPEVPFRSAAIYKYVGADMTPKQIDMAEKKFEEEKKFKAAMPYFYPIRKQIPGKGRIPVAWLRLRRDADPKEYVAMLPQTNKYYLDTIPFADNPGKGQKILSSEQFKELAEKLKQNGDAL